MIFYPHYNLEDGWCRTTISYHQFHSPESFEIKNFVHKSFGNKSDLI